MLFQTLNISLPKALGDEQNTHPIHLKQYYLPTVNKKWHHHFTNLPALVSIN